MQKRTLIKIHVAMSTETRQFPKYLYILIIYCLILFFQKVLLCSRTGATDRHRTTSTTRLDNMSKFFFQLINSIDITLGTNRETTPPIFIPNQCCISSRLFFTVTNQISATVQDLKIRVQVVAPHRLKIAAIINTEAVRAQ